MFRFVAQCGRRAYHSTSHPASNIIINKQSPQGILFTKALEHVPKYGFSKMAINAAVADLGYSDSIQSAVSATSNHSQEFLLVLFWLKFQRQNLYDHVLNPKSKFHSIGDEYERGAYLLKERLLYNEPVIGHLTEVLSRLVLPYNWQLSLEELHNLSDDIAFYAGDESNDSAWYAKRFLLSTIYVKSELFMILDTSANFERTKQFVDESVASMKTLGYSYSSVEQWAVFNAISTVNLIKSQLTRG